MIIFAHDHKLRFDNEVYYSQGGLSDSITQRYTDIYGDLTLICRAIPKKPKEDNLSQIKNPKVRVVAVHSGSLLISSDNKRSIKSTVKEADAVIVRLPSIIGELVYKYAKKYNKPILSEVVTCPWDSLWNHSIKGKMMAPIMWYKTRKSVKKSDYVLYVTKSFLQRRYPTDGVQIGCSDVELVRETSDSLSRRLEKINNTDVTGPLVIGTLASLETKFKGQQYVIRAIAKLKREEKIFKYRLAGGGNNSYLLKEAKKYGVEDLIIWDGLVPHHKVFDWFSSIDLYMQPSEQEGLPRALVEAMSRACPCLGSDVGGIPELLRPNDIFLRSSSETIYEKLSQLHMELLKGSSVHNHKKAKEYTKEELEPIRENFYKEFYDFFRLNK